MAAVGLVGAFDARGQICCVAHGRVVEAAFGADVADQGWPGVDAAAGGQAAARRQAQPRLDLDKGPLTSQRRQHRVAGVGRIVERGAENRQHRVAYILVDETAVGFDDIGHRRQVSENVAAQLLGHARGFTFGGTYSPQGLTLAQRQEAVEKVAFDLKPDE